MISKIKLPDRDREHERVLGRIFDISPSQAAVLSCLSRCSIVTAKELKDYTGVKAPIKIAVSRTRSKLEAHGLFIENKPNVGYWISEEDRNCVDFRVKEFMGEA